MDNNEIIDIINKKYDINENHVSKTECDYKPNMFFDDIVALIGGSGTGKTTILRNIIGKHDVRFEVNSNDCLLKLLHDVAPEKSIEELQKVLFDVGLCSVPVWKNSYHVISNGEKMRFELAYKILSEDKIIHIDEFTSMLDRQTAKNLCYNLNKLLAKYKKKLIFTSCHFDILEWMQIDEIYNTNLKKSFAQPSKKLKEKNIDWKFIQFQKIAGPYLSTIII